MSSSRVQSSFTGVPGHLLGDQDGLGHVVVEGAAPAEAAAEVDLVDLALVGRQAGGRQGRRERGLAVLRRHPDLAAVRRVLRRGVHRLHRRVVLERIGVDRLDLLGRAGDGGLDVAVLVGARRPGRRRGRPSACRRSWRSTPWRSGPRPRRWAARRARSWPATTCRPPRRPRNRRPAPRGGRPACP